MYENENHLLRYYKNPNLVSRELKRVVADLFMEQYYWCNSLRRRSTLYTLVYILRALLRLTYSADKMKRSFITSAMS